MAFPLAHPAAVLPLRRVRWLKFPALIIGSIVPDIAYVYGPASDFSHQLLGSLVFGLPAGGLILALFYGFRTKVIQRMPAALKRSLLPLCQRPPGPVWIVILSLVIGIWSHVLWDGFTHKDGWFVEQIPILSKVLFQYDGRTARLCTVLWYASSLLGAIWLFLSFEKWKGIAAQETMSAREIGRTRWRDAILLASAVVPISLLHHLVRSPIGFVMTGAFSLSLGVVLVLRMASTGEDTLG
ncbi:MAG TPA: DUF4184 family protein [Terriglobia bacterium]|jgi:hypothetical protein